MSGPMTKARAISDRFGKAITGIAKELGESGDDTVCVTFQLCVN